MRPRAELDFIYARVLAHIRANPPTQPLLTETAPRPRQDTCQRGHTAMRLLASGKRRCIVCERARKISRRAAAKDAAS